jgi:hypothetical protein
LLLGYLPLKTDFAVIYCDLTTSSTGRQGEGCNMKKLLIGVALFAQSAGANGQTSTSKDEGCLKVSATVAVCLTKDGQKTWGVSDSGDQLVFLPDPRVRIEVRTMPFNPEWGLNVDEIAARIAQGIALKEGEKLKTWGLQGSFQDWGHVGTQEFEINSADDECTQWVTYRSTGDGAMLLISSHYCSASWKSYSEVEHYELLRSIWIK